jgi:hypothetical protein
MKLLSSFETVGTARPVPQNHNPEDLITKPVPQQLLSRTLFCHIGSFYESSGTYEYILRIYLYRVIQEESAILWETIVCVILNKKVHMNMGPILNGYRDMVKRRYGRSCEHEQQLRNK